MTGYSRRYIGGHPFRVSAPVSGATNATAYTMSESATSGSGNVGVTLTFTPTSGVWPGVTITLAVSTVTYALSNGSGGTLAGNVLTVPVGTSTACTITLTPTSSGTATISATNSGSMTNPGNLTYTVGSASTTFTISLSSVSGATGAPVALTATPGSGGWPSGKVVTVSAATLTGAWDNTSLTGNGTTPLTFTYTPSSGAGTTGTLDASAASMTRTPGAQSYTVTALTSASTANRFDVLAGNSAVASGTSIPLTIIPNGNWPSGSITLAGTAGSFSPSATVTLSAGTNTPVTVNYTPSAVGEHAITATNSAGVYNPHTHPVNVFAASSGTARTITAKLSLLDQVVHQRDTASGNPTGFSFSWAKGWGEVWITISAISGSSGGLFVKLYDAMSSGASGTVGTGTVLNSTPVQVYGTVSATGEIRVLLPAGPYVYYADVATDAAFTNPVRLPQRFKVGHVRGLMCRSQEDGEARAWAYGGQAAVTTTYNKAATWVSYVSYYSYDDGDPGSYTNGVAGWYVHDGVHQDPWLSPTHNNGHYGEYSSSGTMEFGRLCESLLGVCGGIIGQAGNGGGLDQYINHDGSAVDAFAGTVNFGSRGKFRDIIIMMGGWDGTDSTNYPTESFAESMGRYARFTQWLPAHFPSCAVISLSHGASGWFGNDGSRTLGNARYQCAIASQLEATNPMVVSRSNLTWNDFWYGHSTMAARINFVRAGWRQALTSEIVAFGGTHTAQRGPTLGAGTIASGSRTIRVPGNLNGGASLTPVLITYSDPTYTISTATNTQLASLFAVYQSGGYSGNGTAIKIDSATINTSNLPSGADFTIDLVLSGTTGITYADNSTASMPSTFTVHYGCDLGISNPALQPAFIGGYGYNIAGTITDNRIDTVNGIPFGWEIRPAIDLPITTV